jgi:hypothetical protein
VESVIASCGTDKQCVQNTLFGNQNTLQKVFGLSFSSCAQDLNPFCDQQRVLSQGQVEMTPERFEVLEKIQPDFLQRVVESPVFNFDKQNLFVGHQLAQFLDAYHEVTQAKLPSPEIEKLVKFMSQSIVQLSYSSANQSASVGTIIGYSDQGNEKALPLGSSPDKKPNDYQKFVAEEISKLVPNLQDSLPNSVKTDTSATVICKTANGTTQVMPQGTVCN